MVALCETGPERRRITGLARKAMKELRLNFPCSNILMNNIAQVVEMVYSVEHALHLIDEMLGSGMVGSAAAYKVHACSGAAATEVPRGRFSTRTRSTPTG